jgi:hypothetical protein
VVSILLYGDDLIILAENEAGLQLMLDKCTEWCHQWRLNINSDKTKVVHYRNQSQAQTSHIFSCMGNDIEVVAYYKYLGVIFQENLKFDLCAKVLADSTSRAFGFIVSKFKMFKTIDYYIFKKLFDSCLTPIMDYGAGVWGYKDYNHINTVQNRIARWYLGVHRFAPNLGVWGDMGWVPAQIRRKVELVRLWCRLIRMDDVRLTKRLFMNDLYNCKYLNVKNWSYEVKCIFEETDQIYLFETETTHFRLQNVLDNTKKQLFDVYKRQWLTNLDNYPKLRTYKLLKSEYSQENYVCNFFSKSERSFLAQLRLGILPLQIEIGRFTSPLTPIENRICLCCDLNCVENEIHFVLECPLYNEERSHLVNELLLNESLFTLKSDQLFVKIVTNPNIKLLAKFVKNCYYKRSERLYRM